VRAADIIGQLRQDLDQVGGWKRKLLMLGDGGYCNRTIFAGIDCERTHLLVRCRKDAVLCMPAGPDSRKVYGEQKFTPTKSAKAMNIPGKRRRSSRRDMAEIQFKRIDGVLWQREPSVAT
jgi:hypothetical protein